MGKIDTLGDMGYEDSVVFRDPDYDGAIIGVTSDGQVVYDYELMVAWLSEHDSVTAEEAADFIDYNTIRALSYIGEKAPIVMYRLVE